MQADVASRCEQLHRRIDATADRAAFTDGPWTPTDLKEVVSLTLGCDQASRTSCSESRHNAVEMPAFADRPIAVIPAAGLGLRLGAQGSKEIVDVGGEPVAAHLLRRLALAGIDQAIVVLRKAKSDVREALSRYDDVDLSYVVVEESPSELHSVAAGLSFTDGRLVALGYPDILFEPPDSYSALIQCQEATGADLVLGLFPTDRPERVDMVELDDEQQPIGVVIKQPDRGLRYSWSIALWTPRFSALLTSFIAAGPKTETEPSVGDVVQAAIDDDLTIQAVVFEEGSYLDVGTPDDLAKARRIATR